MIPNLTSSSKLRDINQNLKMQMYKYYTFKQNIISAMSFCQKHRNHHCLHAHNCKDPQHHKLNQQSQASKQPHRPLTAKNRSKHQKQTCTFLGDNPYKTNPHINDELLKQLHEKDNRMCQLIAAETSLKQKQQKLLAQNKDLMSQIQYYRDQFSTLIGNNTVDTRNEINKRVKESIDLTLRIKSLQSENKGLLNQNQRLRFQLQDERHNKLQHRQINSSIEDKYHTLHSKLKAVDRQKQESKQNLKHKNRQYQNLQQNYQILKQQFSLSSQKSKKQKDELSLELQQIKKQYSKFKSAHGRDKQIFQLERQNQKKKHQLLRAKLDRFQTSNKQFSETVKTLQQKCQQLEQDLTHAKNIIHKNQQFKQDYHSIQSQMNQKRIEEKTVIKQSRIYHQTAHNQNNKENQILNAKDKSHLEQEILSLKLKITELQKRNMTNFEQIILNLGASEAFRKLLEEKNTVIKKLMREKGQIYAKMALHSP